MPAPGQTGNWLTETKLKRKSWMERTSYAISSTVEDWLAIMSTRDFWAIFAVGATTVGFLVAAIFMMINFDMMRMRSCFNASNLNAYVMFNVLLFFAFAGACALGEAFNYFESRRRGIQHTFTALFWFFIVTVTLGSSGLVLLKVSC